MTDQDKNARTVAEEHNASTEPAAQSHAGPAVSETRSTEREAQAYNHEQTGTPVSREPKQRSNAVSITLSVIAIAIALAVAGGMYHYSESVSARHLAADGAVVNQLNALSQQFNSQKSALETQLAQQSSALEQADKQQAALKEQLDEMQHKVASLTGNDGKVWLIAQADFLVKLAGRKLWSDQDATTAAALLKSADTSLSEMNDPSLINVRRALTADIASLSAVAQIDYDGIILKLNQLSNNVDDLRLADNYQDDAPMDSDSSELSSSINEWRQNLLKSWHSFTDSFITVRRRDDTAVPLLAPNQDIYLRENIRSRLLIAAQAVPRHQQEIYKQSLENVSTWVRAYYDTNDTATKVFLDEVDGLLDQNISMNVPDNLTSQPLLEKLVQTRVRNLLAQPTALPETQQAVSPHDTQSRDHAEKIAPEQDSAAHNGGRHD